MDRIYTTATKNNTVIKAHKISDGLDVYWLMEWTGLSDGNLDNLLNWRGIEEELTLKKYTSLCDI